MSTYTLNMATFGATEYTGVSFLGMAEVDGTVVGITETDFVELTGTTDQGTAITSYIKTGELSIGHQEYNIPKAVVVTKGSEITLERFTKELGASQTPDAITVSVSSELDEYEILTETRQHARSYQLKLTFDGLVDYFGIYVNPVRHRRG